MDLQIYAVNFQQFLNKKYILTAARKGQVIEIPILFNAENFHHLLGLHKLADMPAVARLKNKYQFYKDVLQGQFSDLALERSTYFPDFNDRLSCMVRIENLLQQNIVLRFDKRKAYTSINAQILLYEFYEKKYIHLFFNKTKNDTFSPCSLFSNPTTKYIYHQEIYKIIDIQTEDY